MSDQPVPPKERHYKFFKRRGPKPEDVEELDVPESELTHEQTLMLANSLRDNYNQFPGPAQDIFMKQIIDEEIKLVEAAEKSRIFGDQYIAVKAQA